MKREDGIYLEKVVQLIERSIDPEAIVSHDVQLPILTSISGATTQCDVVIKTGKPPRELITIVEVQNRGNKPKANDFRGWQKKLENVGAARLICVSKRGFTTTQKEEASNSGNRICLIHLNELDIHKIPLKFLEIQFEYNDFTVINIENIAFTLDPRDKHMLSNRELKLNGNVDEKVFSWDKSTLVSLHMLCRDLIMSQPKQRKGINRFIHPVETSTPFYMHIDDLIIRMGIDFKFHWINNIRKIPVSIMTYEQDDYGVLAWYVESKYKTQASSFEFKFALTRHDNDEYQLSNINLDVAGGILSFSVDEPEKQ